MLHVIIPAGGRGERFGSDVPKQFALLAGMPIIIHTLQSLYAIPEVASVTVALRAGWSSYLEDLCGAHGIAVPTLAEGGKERSDSVQAALQVLPSLGDDALVGIHDAVRPLVSREVVLRVCEGALLSGACVPVLPLSDTVKEVDAACRVVRTPARASLRAVQTPQVFRLWVIRRSMEAVIEAGAAVTDDASAAEYAGYEVLTVEGHPSLMKITQPADMVLAEWFLARRAAGATL